MSGKPPGKKSMIPQPFVDVAIAAALVGSVFLAMFAYSGNWPPLVVIESKSMQHSDVESQIGIMDTGDLAMVKTVSSLSDITTYASGRASGYSTYGDYGDVVIYWKAGDRSKTPIIHRAVIYLEAEDDGFSAPELQFLEAGSDYTLSNSSNSWDHITGDFHILDYGFRGANVKIPVENMIAAMETHGSGIHGGFITKGDNNNFVDQASYISVGEPVSFEWVHGVATGEIPWFGAIKLFLTGSLPDDAPGNSILFLWVSIIAIATIPIGTEGYIWLKSRREATVPIEEKKDGDREPPKK